MTIASAQLFTSNDRLLRFAGVHDPLSARIATEARFDGLWISSFGVSACYLGLPDIALLTLNEMLDVSRRIRLISDLPIMIDADTGYGDSVSVRRLIKEATLIGIDAVCIEDAAFPKRNSFIGKSHRALASTQQMCERVKMARMTRGENGPQIVARTEVFTQGGAIEQVYERADAYRAAGADAIIVHSVHPEGVDVLEVASRWTYDCPLIAIPTAYSRVPLESMRATAIGTVIIANQLLRASHRAMLEIASHLRETPQISAHETNISAMKEISACVLLSEFLGKEKEAAVPTPVPQPLGDSGVYALDYTEIEGPGDMEPLRDLLERDGVAIVHNVPSDVDTVVSLSRRFGEPMVRRGTSPTAGSGFIGDVRLRPDLAENDQLPTQRSVPLPLHSARSFEQKRPRYMMMLMVDPGWPSEDGTPAGQSHLLRWTDAVAQFRKQFPDTADRDLKLLSSTDVAYKPWYVAEEPAVEPLLSVTGRNEWTARYWDSVVDQIDSTTVFANGNAEAYRDAVRRFDSVVQSCERTIRLQLAANDLVIFDNTRVAHGRSGFTAIRPTPDGGVEYNSRRLWTIHVDANPSAAVSRSL